mgnify:CR=1 FL=1
MNGEEVLPQVAGGQMLLFPEHPRELCRTLGVNWWVVTTLHHDGLLSFDPEIVYDLDEGQEAEIRFLAGLITGHCGYLLLGELLRPLPMPFRYRHSEIYYNWQDRRWRPLPTPEEPSVAFADWLTALTDSGDRASLISIRNDIERAIESMPDDLARFRRERARG